MAKDEQAAIEQFLEGNPSAAQLRQWRETLRARAGRLRQELKMAGPEQVPALKARLAEMNRQIAALEREEMISEFVEQEVRYTLAVSSMGEGEYLEE